VKKLAALTWLPAPDIRELRILRKIGMLHIFLKAETVARQI
jgi:hypothetical protein